MQTIVGNIYKYRDGGILKYFVYLGDSDDASVVIGGEIGQIEASRSYVAITGLHMVLFVDKLLSIRRKDIDSPLCLGGKTVSVDARCLQSLLIGIVDYYIGKYRNTIIQTVNNNYDSLAGCLIDITLGEKFARLLEWNQTKKILKFDTIRPQMPKCYKYGIYFAYLGTNIGSEINKLRPVLVWQKHESNINPLDNSYFVFPLSSKIPTKTYNYNVIIRVNGKDNVIHLNDGRRISGLRVKKPLIDNTTNRMYMLKTQDILAVKNAIKLYFNL